MILLDTNVVSESIKPRPHAGVSSWLDALPPGLTFISSITIAEIESGLAIMPDGRRKTEVVRATRKALKQFEGACASFDALAAYRYADIRATRRRSGRPISYQDAQIAAIAVTAGLTLATRNTKDFEGIDGLSLVDPWA
jgi:predicted nucleic acid-binding protein